MAGAIMESVVLSEIIRTQTHRGLDPRLFFFRTSSGIEVDIVVEEAGRLIPIEVKLSATPKPAMAAGIRAFQALFGEDAAPGYVVHPGGHHLPLGTDVIALPLAAL
jgi:hypothetical protein